MTTQTIEALLAALDDCALGLNRTQELARAAIAQPELAQTALLAILACSEEAKRNVLDIIEGLDIQSSWAKD
jgi:hypothetical protein